MKKLLLIQVLIFYICAVPAQNVGEKTGSLLWKVSENGLKHPSYIFGTHHVFPLSFLDSVAGLKQAFASCEQVVGELLLNDMEALGGELQKEGMMPTDSTWQLLLSEDDYRFVNDELTAFFGIGLQGFERLKPAMVSLSYTAMFYQRSFPQIQSGEAIDLWFQQQAVSRGISVIGLETVRNQTDALFKTTSLKEQAADLLCTLRNTDYMESSIKKLNHLYRSADLKGLSDYLREDSPCPMSAGYEVAINDARNYRWLEKLPAIMADKPSFIAVGGLHLAGDVGLLVGLEKIGYKVEAVYK